jgi:hypothetical protein
MPPIMQSLRSNVIIMSKVYISLGDADQETRTQCCAAPGASVCMSCDMYRAKLIPRHVAMTYVAQRLVTGHAQLSFEAYHGISMPVGMI